MGHVKCRGLGKLNFYISVVMIILLQLLLNNFFYYFNSVFEGEDRFLNYWFLIFLKYGCLILL
jgi:hypothetical protein